MKNILTVTFSMLVFFTGGAFADSALATASTGTANLSTEGRTYVGTYSIADKQISVDIDGLTYRGNYATLAEDTAGSSSGARTGSWGRAFLFATSAKILNCQLDAGFPKAIGQCQGAGDRRFQLKTGALNTTVSPP